MNRALAKNKRKAHYLLTMIEKLEIYLQFPFVRYALIVGILIAICSALLGVTLVLKHFSYIGDGLSHVAFGAMAAAAVLGLSNEMLLVLPVTIITAVLLLRGGEKKKVGGDAYKEGDTIYCTLREARLWNNVSDSL